MRTSTIHTAILEEPLSGIITFLASLHFLIIFFYFQVLRSLEVALDSVQTFRLISSLLVNYKKDKKRGVFFSAPIRIYLFLGS